MSRIAAIIIALSLVGCAHNKPKPTVLDTSDPVCEALRVVKVKMDEFPRYIDLDEYKSVVFEATEDKKGDVWITVSYEDYKKIGLLLRKLRNHIHDRNVEYEEIMNFYNKALTKQPKKEEPKKGVDRFTR